MILKLEKFRNQLRQSYIGKEVICVKDASKNRFFGGDEKQPLKGQIYKIRDIRFIGDRTGIYLEEIVNPTLQYDEGPRECCFSINLFKLLTSQDWQEADEALTDVLPQGIRIAA